MMDATATQNTNTDNASADAQFADAFNEMTGKAGAAQAPGEVDAEITAELPADVSDAGAGAEADDGAAQAGATEGGLDVQAAVDAQEQGGEAAAAAPADDMAARMEEMRKTEQRLKSWEGRLKAQARQQGLPQDPSDPAYADKPEGQDADDEMEDVAKAAEAMGDTALADAAEALAEKVDDAEITPDEARRILAEDFGDSFLSLIDVLVRNAASKQAGDALGEFKTSTSAEIETIKNAYLRNHFKQIQRAHSDFKEVAGSPEFKAFLDEDPTRQEIAAGGDALDVVDLLDQFKAQAKKIDATASDETMATDDTEGAEAVRATGGINLPATPTKDQSYEEAWNTF